MKVALIRLLGSDRFDFNSADYNVGLRYLAEIVRNLGAVADIFDPLCADDVDLAAQKLSGAYSMIGFTVHHLNVLETLTLVEAVKRRNAAVYIILGGHHVSATATEILQDCRAVDAVCVGDGEDIMQHLTRLLLAGKPSTNHLPRGVLRPERAWELGLLPVPSPPSSFSTARILTSRGCPYNCSFCTTPAMRGIASDPSYRVRDPDSVIEEIRMLKRLGIREIRVNDDLFFSRSTQSRSRVQEIAKKILVNGFDIQYRAQLRVDSVTENDVEFLKVLRQSGLRSVFLGVESGNNAILDEYNKRTNLQYAVDALSLYHRARISVNAGNILLSPDGTVEDVLESIEGFHKMGLAFLFFRRVTFCAHVFPGTALESRLEQEGRLERKRRYFMRSYTFRDPRLEELARPIEQMMPQFLLKIGGELFRLRDRIVRAYYDDRQTLRRDPMPFLADWNQKSKDFLCCYFSRPNNPATRSRATELFEWYTSYCETLKRGFLRCFI